PAAGTAGTGAPAAGRARAAAASARTAYPGRTAGGRAAGSRWAVARGPVSFAHQVLEHRFQIVVFRPDFLDAAAVLQRQRRQPGVEPVGLPRLDHHLAVLVGDLEPLHVGARHQPGGELAVVAAHERDAVRVLVDQVAELADVAFGHEPAVIEQDDPRRQRLHLVEDVAGDDDAFALGGQREDDVHQLAAGD